MTASPAVDLLPARRLCAFRIEELALGVDVALVQEVTERLPLTDVPHAPHGVRGLINLRGRLITALDLHALLALGPPSRVDRQQPVDLVVRHGDELFGLLVEDVSEVVEVRPEHQVGRPRNLVGPLRGAVSGVHNLPGGVLLELDVSAVLRAARAGTVPSPSHGSPTS